MNLETVRRLADEAGFEFHERFEGEFCGSLAMLQQFAELVMSEATDEAWDDIELAEVIMSDCGASSHYEPLKERIAKRIAKHVAAKINDLAPEDHK